MSSTAHDMRRHATDLLDNRLTDELERGLWEERSELVRDFSVIYERVAQMYEPYEYEMVRLLMKEVGVDDSEFNEYVKGLQ